MGNVTLTIAPTGGQYTTLAAAVAGALAGENGANHDLITAMDGVLTFSISGTWSSADTTAVYFNGFHTDATHYIVVSTTGDARHAGVWSTSKYILAVTNDKGLQSWLVPHIRIDGLQISVAAMDAVNENVLDLQDDGGAYAADYRVSNCIIKGAYDAVQYQRGLVIGTAGTGYSWNNIIYGVGGPSGAMALRLAGGGTFNIYSTTGIGGETGLSNVSGTVTAKNCYFGGASYANADFYGTITKTNCASEDLSGDDAPATNCLTGIALGTDTFVNVTATTEDFHLAVDGLSPLEAAGIDTTGDAAPLNFTTDIDLQTRQTAAWDIGADGIPAGISEYDVNVSDSTLTVSTTPTMQQLCGNEIGVFIDEDTLRMKDRVG